MGSRSPGKDIYLDRDIARGCVVQILCEVHSFAFCAPDRAVFHQLITARSVSSERLKILSMQGRTACVPKMEHAQTQTKQPRLICWRCVCSALCVPCVRKLFINGKGDGNVRKDRKIVEFVYPIALRLVIRRKKTAFPNSGSRRRSANATGESLGLSYPASFRVTFVVTLIPPRLCAVLQLQLIDRL